MTHQIVQSTQLKCDRCGKIEDLREVYSTDLAGEKTYDQSSTRSLASTLSDWGAIETRLVSYRNTHADLCPQCAHDFATWWREGSAV